MQEKIWEILEAEKECDGGVTQLVHGDLAVRILGHRAQKLQEVAEEIKAVFEEKRESLLRGFFFYGNFFITGKWKTGCTCRRWEIIIQVGMLYYRRKNFEADCRFTHPFQIFHGNK